MWIQIVVVPVGESPIAAWDYRRLSSQEMVMIDAVSGKQWAPIDAWSSLAGKISRLSTKPQYSGVEVFLKWKPTENGQPDFLEFDAWKVLLDDARNHSWGGRTYLAWKKSELRFDECSGPALENWLAVITNSGLSGLIELSDEDAAQTSHVPFVTSAQANSARQKKLREFITRDGWRAIFRGGEVIEAVLGGLMDKDLVPIDSKNEIIVYERKPKKTDLENLNSRARWHARQGQVFRCDVTGNRLQLEPGIPTIHFNGVFEWLHAFIQLNGERNVPRQRVPRTNRAVTFVKCDDQKNVSVGRKSRRLLITSAFGPHELDDCVAAANEIGACLRRLPFDVEVDVWPCISCEQLPDLLSAKDFSVWYHITHGKTEFGLREVLSPEFISANQSKYVSAERWRHCVDACRGKLELVFLSACQSAEIAHELAKRGIGVAVGFKNDVYVGAARRVAERLIPAAFERRDRRRVILDAFETAYQDLENHSYEEYGKIKYYLDCSPQIFVCGEAK
jgi:hypothetical protein